MRILFITSSRIGDAVLSTGLLDHLMRTYPEARFTVACGPDAEGVFTRMPRCERLILIHKRSLGLHWAKLWTQVVLHRWDLVVDLRGSLVGLLIPARQRVIKRGGRRPGHRLLHIAAVMKLHPAPRPVAWFAPEDSARIDSLLGTDAPLLVLAPTATWSGKLWPADRFARLARILTGPDGVLPGAQAIVLGGPGEREHARAAPLLAALPEAIDLVGAVTLTEATALCARAALFVGNDSGLMHIAAASGAPTLGLFGPTRASEYAPVGPRVMTVLARGRPGRAPMGALSVAKVLDAAVTLLARPDPVPVAEMTVPGTAEAK